MSNFLKLSPALENVQFAAIHLLSPFACYQYSHGTLIKNTVAFLFCFCFLRQSGGDPSADVAVIPIRLVQWLLDI